MSNHYPPPPMPPMGYDPNQGVAPQPQYQQAPQQGYAAPGYPPPGAPPAPQQQQQSQWVDNRQIIGQWTAAQHGMETGKYIEYKVLSQPTAKGGVFKSVKFFKPYRKKNGTMGEGDSFHFNMMKELIERINHFVNTYCEEKGFFIWQPGGMMASVQQPQYQQPAPQYQQPAPPPVQQQPQWAPPQQQQFAAPGYAPPAPQPQQQPAPQYTQPMPPNGPPWP